MEVPLRHVRGGATPVLSGDESDNFNRDARLRIPLREGREQALIASAADEAMPAEVASGIKVRRVWYRRRRSAPHPMFRVSGSRTLRVVPASWCARGSGRGHYRVGIMQATLLPGKVERHPKDEEATTQVQAGFDVVLVPLPPRQEHFPRGTWWSCHLGDFERSAYGSGRRLPQALRAHAERAHLDDSKVEQRVEASGVLPRRGPTSGVSSPPGALFRRGWANPHGIEEYVIS